MANYRKRNNEIKNVVDIFTRINDVHKTEMFIDVGWKIEKWCKSIYIKSVEISNVLSTGINNVVSTGINNVVGTGINNVVGIGMWPQGSRGQSPRQAKNLCCRQVKQSGTVPKAQVQGLSLYSNREWSWCLLINWSVVLTDGKKEEKRKKNMEGLIVLKIFIF